MSIHARVAQAKFKSPAQEAMVGVIVAASHLIQALEEVCGAHGITHDQYNVLRILRGARPHGHPRYAIAERLMSRAPDVTRLLDRLSRDGLVERHRSPADRRLSISKITESGLSLLGQLDPEILSIHERYSAGLNTEEVAELTRLCSKLTEAD